MSGDSPAYVQATNVMSAIAAAGNIILFGAQIPLVWRMHTVDRDASKYDPLPSYTLLACMSLWSGYAVWVLPTTQLFIANFSGVVLPLAYLFFFALHSRGWAPVAWARAARRSQTAPYPGPDSARRKQTTKQSRPR